MYNIGIFGGNLSRAEPVSKSARLTVWQDDVGGPATFGCRRHVAVFGVGHYRPWRWTSNITDRYTNTDARRPKAVKMSSSRPAKTIRRKTRRRAIVLSIVNTPPPAAAPAMARCGKTRRFRGGGEGGIRAEITGRGGRRRRLRARRFMAPQTFAAGRLDAELIFSFTPIAG